jgi:hypothetical protein
MESITRARDLLALQVETPLTSVLSELMSALERETEFHIHRMYSLSYNDFEFVLTVIRDWRLARYYSPHLPLHLGDRSFS